jgi:hypothetical protein
MGEMGTASPPQGPRHLTQDDLAGRWRISERTLERWRWQRLGPNYIKIGGRVVYRLADVLSYESTQLHTTAPANDPFFRKAR